MMYTRWTEYFPDKVMLRKRINSARVP